MSGKHNVAVTLMYVAEEWLQCSCCEGWRGDAGVDVNADVDEA